MFRMRTWLRRRQIAAGAADRGSVTVETVVIVPIIVFLTMAVIQFALVWHGKHVAQAAAQSGVVAAAGYQRTLADGTSATSAYLEKVAPSLLGDPDVTGAAGTGTVSITVRAHVTSLVPFTSFDISESATAPIEQFTAPGGP